MVSLVWTKGLEHQAVGQNLDKWPPYSFQKQSKGKVSSLTCHVCTVGVKWLYLIITKDNIKIVVVSDALVVDSVMHSNLEEE